MPLTKARRASLRQVAINTVVAVGGVCLTFRWPLLCAAIMAALLAATLQTWRTRRDRCVAIAGCLAGVTLELAATRAGLWQYAYPTVAGLPAWVSLLWPTFCVGLPRLAETLVAQPDRRLPPLHSALLGVAILALEIPMLAVSGNPQPWPVTVALCALGASAFVAAPSYRLLVVLAVGAGFGFACELLPVQLGIWQYPLFRSAMPPWLAPGYAVFGLGVVHLGEGMAGPLSSHRPGSR